MCHSINSSALWAAKKQGFVRNRQGKAGLRLRLRSGIFGPWTKTGGTTWQAWRRWWQIMSTAEQKQFKSVRACVHRHKSQPAAAESPHLDERMPVGDGFSRICQHFTPVVSTKRVCIIAHPTHSDDLIMAHPVRAAGRVKWHWDRMHDILSVKREKTFGKVDVMETKAEIIQTALNHLNLYV